MKRVLPLVVLLLISTSIFASFPIPEIMTDPNEGIHKTVGYLMGMFMLIFGVIIAYAYNNKTMVKAAWKGFLTVVGIFVLYLIILFVLYSFSPSDFIL